MTESLEFRIEPGEVQEKIEELVAGALYRVWMKSGSCVVEFTSVLLDFEVVPQPDLGEHKVASLFLLKFENSLVLQSRTGWGAHFYRKGEVS